MWLSKQSKATWKVRKTAVSAVGDRSTSVSAVGESGYEVVTLIGSEGVGILRLWVGKQRRIVNTSGSKAWSLCNFCLMWDLFRGKSLGLAYRHIAVYVRWGANMMLVG